MKKFSILIALTFIIIFQSAVVFGLELEIKGIRLGMTETEVQEKMDSNLVGYITIAGVRSKYPVGFEYYNGKLDHLTILFDSNEFETIAEAVKAKYPQIKCNTGKVTNGYGASFTQKFCELKGKTGELILFKFLDTIETSCLSLKSNRLIKQNSDEHNKKKKDL